MRLLLVAAIVAVAGMVYLFVQRDAGPDPRDRRRKAGNTAGTRWRSCFSLAKGRAAAR